MALVFTEEIEVRRNEKLCETVETAQIQIWM